MKTKLSIVIVTILAITSVAFWYRPQTVSAAVAASNLTKSGSAAGATSYATGSFTIPANQLVLATFSSRTGITADPTQPTASGCGATWVVVQSVVYDTAGSSRKRETMFRTLAASSSSCTVTFDEAGQSQTNAQWAIDTFTGADTSGTNGSGAVVQSVANSDPSATASTLTVTLAAFSSANNATYGAFANGGGSSTMTVGAGFTQISNDSTSAACNTLTEFNAANDTSVDWTTGVNDEMGGIAIEIKAGAVVPTVSSVLNMQNQATVIKDGAVVIKTP